MPPPSQSILADIVRLGNTPIVDKTIPDLQALLAKVLDYADSLAAKGTTMDDLADFQETLDDLTGVADTLDAACDAYDMADDEDAREEALEAAGEALADLAGPLQDLDSIAEYIPTTEADVAKRWGADLKRLANLPQGQFRPGLDGDRHAACPPPGAAPTMEYTPTVEETAAGCRPLKAESRLAGLDY